VNVNFGSALRIVSYDSALTSIGTLGEWNVEVGDVGSGVMLWVLERQNCFAKTRSFR